MNDASSLQTDEMKNVKNVIEKIEKDIFLFLTTLQKKYRIWILSNSENGWIRSISQSFMPSLIPLLFENSQIEIHSARYECEDKKTIPSFMWKHHCIDFLLKNRKSVSSIITIGDVDGDIYPLLEMADKNGILACGIKFMEHPLAAVLRMELGFVIKHWEKILSLFSNNLSVTVLNVDTKDLIVHTNTYACEYKKM